MIALILSLVATLSVVGLIALAVGTFVHGLILCFQYSLLAGVLGIIFPVFPQIASIYKLVTKKDLLVK